MYIYELPYEINKELCRLLDIDDLWKELAGNHMKYSTLDVIEIDQKAHRLNISPTCQLFKQWGQLNHKVDELGILLDRLPHMPALLVLEPVVSDNLRRLIKRRLLRNGADSTSSRQVTQPANDSIIPLFALHANRQFEERERAQPVSSNTNGTTRDSTTTDDSTSCSRRGSSRQPMDDELVKKVSAVPFYKYEELQKATDNWNEDRLLGRGGFGQVFRGELRLLPVAIKRLTNREHRKLSHMKELLREMLLNQYRHDNILPLYAYSTGGPEVCIVYQLMAGGSLEQRLRHKSGQPPLDWLQRHSIAHGVARGLQYLHSMYPGKPLIHGDIKPANILLDQCLVPKIGDFGLAREGPHGPDHTHLTVTSTYGTPPYIPEEYIASHHLSIYVDVYSFGVVLLELATALPSKSKNYHPDIYLANYSHRLAENNFDFASLEDPSLRGGAGSRAGACRAVCSLALAATRRAARDRPDMLAVYHRLQDIRDEHLRTA